MQPCSIPPRQSSPMDATVAYAQVVLRPWAQSANPAAVVDSAVEDWRELLARILQKVFEAEMKCFAVNEHELARVSK